VRVPSGAPDHSSGGDASAPSQVYLDGIDPLGVNAVDVSFSGMGMNETGFA
jgi:hypothetical protein